MKLTVSQNSVEEPINMLAQMYKELEKLEYDIDQPDWMWNRKSINQCILAKAHLLRDIKLLQNAIRESGC